MQKRTHGVQVVVQGIQKISFDDLWQTDQNQCKDLQLQEKKDWSEENFNKKDATKPKSWNKLYETLDIGYYSTQNRCQ